MKAPSREPQSRSIASRVAGAVVNGPGVRRKGIFGTVMSWFSSVSAVLAAFAFTAELHQHHAARLERK
jgi:hypothetical protein